MRKLLHKDLVTITVSSLIAGAGSGLVGIFIPLLLINQGQKLWQVCAFYALYALCKLLVNYPMMLQINKRGVRLGLVGGYLASALFIALLSLYVATGKTEFLFVMVPIMALQNSLLWNSQHLHISQAMDSSRKGKDLATIANLGRVIGIFTPLIGGLIAEYIGPGWLAGIAAGVSAAAIVPAWKIKSKSSDDELFSKDLKYNLKQAPLRDMVANFCFNAHSLVGALVWPIYLAVFIPSFTDIGVVTTIAGLIGVVTLQIAGRRNDAGKSYKVLTEGTAASSIVHFGRVIASSNPITITIVSALYDLALDYQFNPWVSIYYAHARDKGINYIMSMEIMSDIAYVVVWCLLGLVAYATKDDLFFLVAFGVAGVIAWGCLFMSPEKRIRT